MKHFKEQLINWEKHDMESENKSELLRKAQKNLQEMSEKEWWTHEQAIGVLFGRDLLGEKRKQL
ncbi:hypothetical protein [Domibacillus mangrovi]|uniref:Uncharacterized protein n=1 Tax=Domibacillus mangrovi TaxID=1714354 RepID=A0A1Q5P3Z2_9BACI|nr:hypothetical protein [Domibacillus mangrovi]OKL36969.1 hypothetical protein BLL40_05090 [Domibacillus mangrovi]